MDWLEQNSERHGIQPWRFDKGQTEKQDDGRWMAKHIVGQPTTIQKKNKRQTQVKKKEKKETISLAKRIKNMLKGPGISS